MKTTRKPRLALIAVLPVLVALGAACSGRSAASSTSTSTASSSESTTTTVERPAERGDLVATAQGSEVHVYASETSAEPVAVLRDPDYSLVFAVEEQRATRVRVLLPTRPNGSTGWLALDEVTIATNPYAVHVSLTGHTLTVTEAGLVVLETAVAVGAAGTPTPTGQFYVLDLLQPPVPDGPYGPYAFGLSAHSDVLTDFGGGDGQVGIHGTNRPDQLGTDASHGCIRVSNEVVEQLAGLLPLGTRVEIVA